VGALSFLTINTSTETVRDLDLAQALGYGRPVSIRDLIKKKLPVLEQFGNVSVERGHIPMPKGGTKEVTEFHLNRKQAIYLTTQALGYRTDRMIRNLIKKHRPMLEQFGPVALQTVTQARKNGASHEVTEFHLNRKQAIYLTTQAGTPKARAMTVFVVEVFDKFMEGKLKPADQETVDYLSNRLRDALSDVDYLKQLHAPKPVPAGMLFAQDINEQFFGNSVNLKKLAPLLAEFSKLEGEIPPTWKNPRTGNVGKDEHRLEGSDLIHPWPFDPRVNAIRLVSESGLYKLIMRSDKPEAREFQDWVTKVVLPGFRISGLAGVDYSLVGYCHTSQTPSSLQHPLNRLPGL